MQLKKDILKYLIVLFLGTSITHAQLGGTSSYSFLNLANSSRLFGLGGSNVSLYDGDANLLISNPAFIDSTMSGAISLNYLNYIADINYGFTSYTQHFKKAGTVSKKKVVEIKDFVEEHKLGDVITVDLFTEGEFVDVQGVSKGKGFQGVVKRHGFGGVGQATHGQHNRLRAPGSVGASSYPSRVFKGMRMAGRMGGDNVKVQNLRVLKVVAEKNLLVIKGCVPGCNNSYVIIQK